MANENASGGGRSKSAKPPPQYTVNLSAPWGDDPSPCFIGSGFQFKAIEQFLIERTRLHEVFIREEAKTKRLGLALGTLLFLAACLVIVFAPESRQGVASWVGAAMLVAAAGVVGYKRVWGKSTILTFSADQHAESGSTGNSKPGVAADRGRDTGPSEHEPSVRGPGG
jgi:hypothetical protein